MPRRVGDFEFESWFLAFAYGPAAGRVIRSRCERGRLQPADADDVLQQWVLKMLGTIERDAVPDWVVDEDSARAFVFKAVRNTVVDIASRGAQSREWVLGESENAVEALERLGPSFGVLEIRDVDDQVVAIEWCEATRTSISARLYTGDVTCDGCPPERVVSLALHVVNTACESDDERGTLETWTSELKGGTTSFDQLMYQAMSQVVPERVSFEDDGRVSKSTRKLKSRCGPCVLEVLADAIAPQGLS